MKVEKIIMFKNPTTGSITHEDQEISDLKFKEIIRDSNNNTIYLINGEESEVGNYLARHAGKASIMTITEAQTMYDTILPIKKVSCPHCNGTGINTIPEFDYSLMVKKDKTWN